MRGRAEKTNGSDTEERREKGSGEQLCEKEERRQLKKQCTYKSHLFHVSPHPAGPNSTVAARRNERGGLALVLN